MSRFHGWHTRVLTTHWRPLILIRPICSTILTCISITTSVTGYVNAIRYLISSRCALLRGSDVVWTNVGLSRNRPSISLTCGDMIDVSYVSIRHLTHSSIRPDTATKAELKYVKALTVTRRSYIKRLHSADCFFRLISQTGRWCFGSFLQNFVFLSSTFSSSLPNCALIIEGNIPNYYQSSTFTSTKTGVQFTLSLSFR